jgi:heat shock protein HslJ
MTCLEEVMNAEIAYFAALESATSWSASESELVLSDSSGQELLRYQSATA